MTKHAVLEKFVDIVGSENVSGSPELLEQYAQDLSFTTPSTPLGVVWPRNTEDVQKIVLAAKESGIPLIPVSSGSPRLHGDTIPRVDNALIVDLGRMQQILRVDRKNRVAMIEPGVTFDQLAAEVAQQGLIPLMPLLPKPSKSIIASYLEREPITIPRYHWDSSDPLLCTEVVFGTGDIFRTGAAAGPGSLEDQWKAGQAQKNPLGPSQFDPLRILQGAQGSMGIITWASVKLERLPKSQKAFFATSDKLDTLLGFTYGVLRRRLGDHLFILNRTNLAALVKDRDSDIRALKQKLPAWILVLTMSGHGKLVEDELAYIEGDIKDIATENNVSLHPSLHGVKILDLLGSSCNEPYWKLRPRGSCEDVLFQTTLDKTPALHSLFSKEARQAKYPEEEFGVYIQPQVQGTCTHCEFNIYYDAESQEEVSRARQLYMKGSKALLTSGAFFSRPYGAFTAEVYDNCPEEIVTALRKVKAIFDPDNILNRGALCFTEVE
ncbi:MAG: FAD-binding oxidoreductase [Promethearchaeota archaeon]